MNVVIDTNVWLSALAKPTSPPGRLIDALLAGQLTVFSSDRLWNELLRALTYERVQQLFLKAGVALPERQVARLGALVTFVDVVEPVNRWVLTDPDDNWVIQCAITARVDRLITGDKAMLALQAVEGIKIVSARGMLEELGLDVV
jgi:putative PIN family toxin of toxin-antitoxin system